MTSDEQVFHDVACTVCGCVCDDLTIRVRNNEIVEVEPYCSLAAPWFERLRAARPVAAMIEGQEASREAALQHAAQLLKDSMAPLVFGLSRSSTAGQRAAVDLADRLGGFIDTTASVCHGPSIMAIQQVGESTSSLGEVKNRSDLVVFWQADPVTSHPRHLERYSADPIGQFLPRGRQDRTIVVVDDQPTATSALADDFYQVQPGRDFEAIWALRQLVARQEPNEEACLGLPMEQLRRLAGQMEQSRYGVVFFGLGLAQQASGHANVEALLRLVAELNAKTRFTARRLRVPGDVTGADCVLCWWTGFPFGVSLQRGYPRYNPGEYTADDLLRRGEVDVCVLVGSESVPMLSEPAQRRLESLPTIVLDSPHQQPSFTPTVHFHTAVYGVHAAGTAYRMDEIPIPLRKVCQSDLPTDDQLLSSLASRITDAVNARLGPVGN
jgi:formylmethanofuran dehydrogenase subunit B